MNSNMPARVAVLTITVGSTAWFVGLAQEATLTFTPFSAERAILSFSGNGEYRSTRLQSFAIRSDGSQVLTMTQPDPSGVQRTERTVWDIQTSVRKSADDRTESYVVFPMRRMAHSFQHRSRTCIDQPLAAERILGYQVVRLEEEFEIPTESGGRFRTVEYQAPGLNCYTLKEEAYQSTGDGPLELFEVKEVVSVVEGEPDPAVFELPRGYTERTPLEVLSEFGRRFPDQALSAEKLEKLRHIEDAHRIANAGR